MISQFSDNPWPSTKVQPEADFLRAERLRPDKKTLGDLGLPRKCRGKISTPGAGDMIGYNSSTSLVSGSFHHTNASQTLNRAKKAPVLLSCRLLPILVHGL